jgi:hypothetical protein
VRARSSPPLPPPIRLARTRTNEHVLLFQRGTTQTEKEKEGLLLHLSCRSRQQQHRCSRQQARVRVVMVGNS